MHVEHVVAAEQGRTPGEGGHLRPRFAEAVDQHDEVRIGGRPRPGNRLQDHDRWSPLDRGTASGPDHAAFPVNTSTGAPAMSTVTVTGFRLAVGTVKT